MGNDDYLEKALQLAKTSDVVIMPIGTSGLLETEAYDRCRILKNSDPLALSRYQERLIQEISQAKKEALLWVVSYLEM